MIGWCWCKNLVDCLLGRLHSGILNGRLWGAPGEGGGCKSNCEFAREPLGDVVGLMSLHVSYLYVGSSVRVEML